jgi:predicted transcriptional regulator
MHEEAKPLSRERGIPAHAVRSELRNEQRAANFINFDLHDGDIYNDAHEEAKDEVMGIEKDIEEQNNAK